MTEKINERLEWVIHKGTRIVFEDFRGLSDEEYIRQIEQNEADLVEIGPQEEDPSLLLYADITDSVIKSAVMDKFKQLAATLVPHTIGCTVLEITGVRKILMDIVRTFSSVNLRGFDTEEECKDRLVELARN